jgi:hypothetical protein
MIKYFLRAVTLPFIAIVVIISQCFQLLRYLKNYVLHGGEFIVYTKKENKKTIGEMYDLITEQIKLTTASQNK